MPTLSIGRYNRVLKSVDDPTRLKKQHSVCPSIIGTLPRRYSLHANVGFGAVGSSLDALGGMSMRSINGGAPSPTPSLRLNRAAGGVRMSAWSGLGPRHLKPTGLSGTGPQAGGGPKVDWTSSLMPPEVRVRRLSLLLSLLS
jgi:hypothetical protein